MEENGKIAFLEVLIIRNNNTLKTTVYRKKTNNRVYLHWKSFAPPTCKCSTLRSIITRVYRICSNQECLVAELLKIKHESTQINGYLKWLFDKITEECKLSGNLNIVFNNKSNINNDITNTTHMLVLPYKGERGQRIIKSVNKAVKKILPQNHVTQNVYKSKKLGSYFNIKDSMKLEHQHDFTYFTQCPGVNYNETYLKETTRRLQERVLEHAGKDRKSNMFKHSMDTDHPLVCMKDFQILTEGFNHCKFKRKICKALPIKKHQPTLDAQEQSVILELFN